ncbi:MAG: hypothetical protein M3Q13_06055 [Pseudomonadota bacterium]|nr:hypothetical protein [Pseudomonadota bacterium]
MTTSSQQTVLTDEEIACLRDLAKGNARPAEAPEMCALIAKGMIQSQSGSCALTPAGMHAVNVSGPGNVPGIDG